MPCSVVLSGHQSQTPLKHHLSYCPWASLIPMPSHGHTVCTASHQRTSKNTWRYHLCVSHNLLFNFYQETTAFWSTSSVTPRKEKRGRLRKDAYKEINYGEEATSDYRNVPQVNTCHWIDFSEKRGWTCMPWLINVPCFLPYLNPRPSHISQGQIERGTDTGLTIKPKVIRNQWKTLHKRQWVRHIQ